MADVGFGLPAQIGFKRFEGGFVSKIKDTRKGSRIFCVNLKKGSICKTYPGTASSQATKSIHFGARFATIIVQAVVIVDEQKTVKGGGDEGSFRISHDQWEFAQSEGMFLKSFFLYTVFRNRNGFFHLGAVHFMIDAHILCVLSVQLN